MQLNEFIVANARKRIIPVIDPSDFNECLDLVQKLVRAGAEIIEITLRTELAYEIFEAVSLRHPNIIFGAGSVLTPKIYDIAVSIGADFTISPSLSPELMEYSLNSSALHIPGVATPTEMQNASFLGCKIIKFYPSEHLGGALLLSDLSRIFPNLLFMPSGSIRLEQLHKYAAIKNVLSVGGSWVYKSDGDLVNFNDLKERLDLSIKSMKTNMKDN